MESMTLKAARVNARLDVGQAASSLNVSPKTLYNWESGVTFPNAKQIKGIETLYGVSYNDLIFLPSDNTLSVDGGEFEND